MLSSPNFSLVWSNHAQSREASLTSNVEPSKSSATNFNVVSCIEQGIPVTYLNCGHFCFVLWARRTQWTHTSMTPFILGCSIRRQQAGPPPSIPPLLRAHHALLAHSPAPTLDTMPPVRCSGSLRPESYRAVPNQPPQQDLSKDCGKSPLRIQAQQEKSSGWSR